MTSIKELLQDADPLRYEAEIPAVWKTRTRQILMKQDIFTTGTSISDSKAWFGSLIRQIQEFLAERRNPRPRAEITAAADPTALDRLVDPPSQISSLIASIKEAFNETFHPHRIEMTAAPVDVEEIWSKRKMQVPGVLSLLTHVVVVTALLYLSVATHSAMKAKVIVGDNDAVLEPIAVSLPPAAVKSGGGGGGGTHQPTPASRGVLPKADTVQFVPPTTIPATMIAEIMVEPTVIDNSHRPSPLSAIGLPTGVLGPPSDGTGSGGGIGTGNGHGVGVGDGPGVGPGKGGGAGGGIYRVGGVGGASAPSCPKPTVEPNYTDDARKARIQGTVTLDAVVNSDGSMSVVNVAHKIGYGLDDEASRFVEKYFKCKPGLYEGKAVATSVKIDVNFHLY
jgi:TonB family protein